jgi:hypothetical protein
VELLGLPEGKPDLLEQLKIILAVPIAVYNDWKKTESEDYIYDECISLFHELSRGDCVDIMEAIIAAANPANRDIPDKP